MKRLKQFTWALLCCLGPTILFSQAEIPPQKFWGLNTGVTSFEIPNAVWIQDEIGEGEVNNARAINKKRIAPNLGFEFLKEGKPGRYKTMNVRVDYGSGNNDVYIYNINPTSPYSTTNLLRNDEIFKERVQFNSYQFFRTEVGLGILWGKNLLQKKLNFLYGFNFLAGYQYKEYDQFNSVQHESPTVSQHKFRLGIDFSGMLNYRINDALQVYAKAAINPVNFGAIQERITGGEDRLGIDFRGFNGIKLFQFGILCPISK